jgi:hypothetical protein
VLRQKAYVRVEAILFAMLVPRRGEICQRQRLKTHAWTEVHAVESTVQHHARVYNRARKSILDLGADVSLLDRC